jgi:serine/threonine protein kinase
MYKCQLYFLFYISIDSPKDLIRKLLVLDPSDRLTVNEALEHPFFNVKVSIYYLNKGKFLKLLFEF